MRTSKRPRLDRITFAYLGDNGPLLGESALSSNTIILFRSTTRLQGIFRGCKELSESRGFYQKLLRSLSKLRDRAATGS